MFYTQSSKMCLNMCKPCHKLRKAKNWLAIKIYMAKWSLIIFFSLVWITNFIEEEKIFSFVILEYFSTKRIGYNYFTFWDKEKILSSVVIVYCMIYRGYLAGRYHQSLSNLWELWDIRTLLGTATKLWRGANSRIVGDTPPTGDTT